MTDDQDVLDRLRSDVWSRTFDGRTANVLALQDLVSSAIVAAFDRR